MCLSVCVCLYACLSHLRYLEREVGSPRCLHSLGELLLASCTNCLSSLHDVRFGRICLENFFTNYTPNTLHTMLHFCLPWAGLLLPVTRKTLEHSRRSCIEGPALHTTRTIHVVVIDFYLNGLQILHSRRS